jgi:hypothetical protein
MGIGQHENHGQLAKRRIAADGRQKVQARHRGRVPAGNDEVNGALLEHGKGSGTVVDFVERLIPSLPE